MRKQKRARSYGFTLVELLIVMAVIGILAGLTFKIWGVAVREGNKAKTKQILERVAHALEEYRSEYGKYPPVSSVPYEFEVPSQQTDYLDENYFEAHPEIVAPKHGLVAYLVARKSGGRHDLEERHPDSDRDTRAKKRWAPFIDGLVSGAGGKTVDDFRINDDPGVSGVDMGYTNASMTIEDAWGNTINYKCKVPFQSYELWSNGGQGSGKISYQGYDN